MVRKSFFDRLFPVQYDFFKMLETQAITNGYGVKALCNWLGGGLESENDKLIQYVKDADNIRMTLEENLVEAFSTPFDRGDIYSISISMDKILEYVSSTLISMKVFDVLPNEIIIKLTGKLMEGMDIFTVAVGDLKKNPKKSELCIPAIRESNIAVERLYRDGMSIVFKGGDPMNALRMREIYHHIKDASKQGRK